MASRRKKPLSPEALFKKRSEAAKKGHRTRRANVKAERLGTEIFETWGKLGKGLRTEAEKRKKASNSRIYGEDQGRIAQLESEAREAEKARKRLEKEIAKLKKEASGVFLRRTATITKLKKKGITNEREQEDIIETVERATGREGWVDVMPDKYLRRDGGIALNPCRLRHTTEYPRWRDLFIAAEKADGGQIAGPSVKAVVKRILREYEEYGYQDYFQDEEPLDEAEIWTLYFSP